MTGGNGISPSNKEKPFLDMIPLPTSTSRFFRAIIAFVCQYALIFILIPLGCASGASEQHPSPTKLIPDSLISLGSEDGSACAILVEKESQRLLVYEHKDNFSLKHEFQCSTGEVAGKKQKSGDRKTPEGVYFSTKACEKRYLSATYGNRAFVIDYPNLIDRKYGRGGYNIWLHGSNKPIKPRDSNGCVVMANDNLETLARYIELNRTPIIIKQELNMVQAESQLADKKDLTSFLEVWQTAFVTGDRAKYIACYSKPPRDLDILWRVWDRVRTNWQRAQIPFDMKLQDLTLVRDNPCVVALFDQVTSVGTHVSVVGTKKLFLEKYGKIWEIIGEEYQPCDSDHGSNGLLVTALNRLDRLYSDHSAIADLVAE